MNSLPTGTYFIDVVNQENQKVLEVNGCHLAAVREKVFFNTRVTAVQLPKIQLTLGA